MSFVFLIRIELNNHFFISFNNYNKALLSILKPVIALQR